MSKIIVTFEKNWRGYAAGETAGFAADVAESLVEAGYAIEAGKQATKKGKAAAESAAPTEKKTGAGKAGAGGTSEPTGDSGKP